MLGNIVKLLEHCVNGVHHSHGHAIGYGSAELSIMHGEQSRHVARLQVRVKLNINEKQCHVEFKVS